ncbi:hypothetical protein B6J71_27865 [Klebsiella quasipneumoniae]|nr:DUF551 domain-containing protein [Klebsiella quasipneumoniae]PLJ63725.1 hypothetical protein B6J71_27865 [Klebsiella quasipneumoniae]
MTSKFNIDNRELLQRISSGQAVVGIDFGNLIVRELAAFRLAAMDSESECLPLDYLQGHKDGLEWAARLAEANHPETGDWLYDDPIELAKAIRKGPDMPPAQPAQVVPEEIPKLKDGRGFKYVKDGVCYSVNYANGWNQCRAAMLAAAQQSPGSDPATVPGKWIPVSERMPEDDDFVYIWPRPDFGVELHVGQYCECSPKGDGWYAQVYEQNYGIEWHPITVTHWMPLPAGPKEDINALIPLVSRNEQEVK